jgi:uncharacterized membrane protein SirB2
MFSLLKFAAVRTKHNICLVGSVTVLVRTATRRIEKNEGNDKKWSKGVPYQKTLYQP